MKVKYHKYRIRYELRNETTAKVVRINATSEERAVLILRHKLIQRGADEEELLIKLEKIEETSSFTIDTKKHITYEIDKSEALDAKPSNCSTPSTPDSFTEETV